MPEPLVTIAVPSLNQGEFLNKALESIFDQNIPVEVFVVDGGSTDSSLEIIRSWENQLAGWRSHADQGQAAAINEGIAKGSAPYVCWLNSDDFYYPGGLSRLVAKLEKTKSVATYANCWHTNRSGKKLFPYITLPFNAYLLANYCFIAQPATLITRSAWKKVGGLDESLHFAMDYDLWWKLFIKFGAPKYCSSFVAANRGHPHTKTQNNPDLHYEESIDVVKRHNGFVPVKWKLMLPVMRLYRSLKV